LRVLGKPPAETNAPPGERNWGQARYRVASGRPTASKIELNCGVAGFETDFEDDLEVEPARANSCETRGEEV
jgi:hypothetical protein